MGVNSLGVRVFWPASHATIPTPGWSRDAAFDERFLQGDDEDYAGPSDVPADPDDGYHTHIAIEHTHIGVSHTHIFSAQNVQPANTTLKDEGRGFLWVPDASPPFGSHTHLSATSAATVITYQDADVTVQVEYAKPPYKKMIVIKPDSVTEDIPDDAVCFTDETDPLPTGFVKYAALDDRFVIGADEEGGDGGGIGGSAEHDHLTVSHTHQDVAHGHDATQCGNADPAFRAASGTPTHITRPQKHHKVTLVPTTLSNVVAEVVDVNDGSSEPAYVKLLGIQNTSGDATTPVGVIVAFVGDADDIPSNWQLCNGEGDTVDCRDKQIWSTATDEEVGDPGGSNTHTHTCVTHDHAHDGAHTHTGNATIYLTRSYVYATPLRNALAIDTHVHVWDVDASAADIGNTVVTFDGTEDKRAAYRTVVWIKKMIERPGPKGLLCTTF